MLCKKTHKNNIKDKFFIFSRLSEKIIPIIKAIKISETFGKISYPLFLNIKIFKTSPKITGKKTIKNKDSTNDKISISTL